MASRVPALPGYAATVDNVDRAGVIRVVSRMVAFMSRKSESKTEIAAVPGQVQRLAVFGPPLLLEGEDAAAYDELLARVCAAVKPADIIDEMFIADIVVLEWEVLRWRRLKWTLMQETGLKALELFLVEQLESNYALHEEHFKSYLTTILQNNLPTEQAGSAGALVVGSRLRARPIARSFCLDACPASGDRVSRRF